MKHELPFDGETMLKAVILIVLVLGPVLYVVYPFVAGELSEMSAKAYKIDLLNTVSLSIDPNIKANITWLGLAKLNNLQAGRMQAKPPLYNYLQIISDAGTFYAAVLWSSGPSGERVAHISSLIVPISDGNSPVSFYYQGFSGAQVLLWTG